MRMVYIAKERDSVVGLRLAGVQSFMLRDDNEIIEKVKELSNDQDVGIINVTKEVYKIAKTELDNIRENKSFPLVVVMPDIG
jgi:V/A-type H+-transporting ATPase subunit F